MKRVIVGVLLGCLWAGAVKAEPGDADKPGSNGLHIYIDPATGEPGVPPPQVQPRAARPSTNEAVSTSDEGLSVRQGESAAGGEILDLEGRFQDEIQIKRDSAGNAASCKHPGAAGTSP